MNKKSEVRQRKKDGRKIKPPPEAVPEAPAPSKRPPKIEKRFESLEDAVTAVRLDMKKTTAEMENWRQEVIDLRNIVNRNTFQVRLLQNIISHHHGGERAEP